MTVTFFGQQDCPEEIRPLLVQTVRYFIEHHWTRMFYVGLHGPFNAMVRSVLDELYGAYLDYEYCILDPHPFRTKDFHRQGFLIPVEGFEDVNPRYAVEFCNRWMLRESDAVIAYVTQDRGAAAKFVAQAKRQGKLVVNLAENQARSS